MLKEQDMQWVNETADKIIQKMDWVSDKSKHKIPYTTVDGVHDDRSDQSWDIRHDDGIAWWTNGFWGGIMLSLIHICFFGSPRICESREYSSMRIIASVISSLCRPFACVCQTSIRR